VAVGDRQENPFGGPGSSRNSVSTSAGDSKIVHAADWISGALRGTAECTAAQTESERLTGIAERHGTTPGAMAIA
jgi:hypothetical protein